VLAAETQHYLRTAAGRQLRSRALSGSRVGDPRVFAALLRTYLEECTHDDSGPSHLELVERLLQGGGVAPSVYQAATTTPGNAAAMALYADVASRGVGCHLIGAGVVEHYYSQLCPRIFEAYTNHYGMTPGQAETYRIHGPMDAEHARRALDVLDATVALHGRELVKRSVRDAFVATSLHYDGMLQAALGRTIYWDGSI
jgi:pyrroloquinoline quinone (PQQ) biosynthesis protein C